MRITLGKSEIHFKGGDEPDSIYGSDYSDAVIDEASRCKEEAWYAVRSTLTATRGRIRMIGNVRGRKNWAYRMARKAEAGEVGMEYYKLTAMDAVEGGVLTQQDIDDAKRDLPAAVFRELYFAEPTEDGSNPFGMSAILACFGEPGDEEAIAYGVDLAKSEDWTVVYGLSESGGVVTKERWQGVPWPETTSRIARIVGDKPALVDSTGVGDPIVDALQQKLGNVEGFKFTSTSKQQLMEGLASALQSGEIRFDDPVLKSELEAFEFEYTRTGVRYSAPEGTHDDCVCGLALGWKCKADRYQNTSYIGVVSTVQDSSDYDRVKDPSMWRKW